MRFIPKLSNVIITSFPPYLNNKTTSVGMDYDNISLTLLPYLTPVGARQNLVATKGQQITSNHRPVRDGISVEMVRLTPCTRPVRDGM
jgi:hypothetical protein